MYSQKNLRNTLTTLLLLVSSTICTFGQLTVIERSYNGSLSKISAFGITMGTVTVVNSSTSNITITGIDFPLDSASTVFQLSDFSIVQGLFIQKKSIGRREYPTNFPITLVSSDTLVVFLQFRPVRAGWQTASMRVSFQQNNSIFIERQIFPGTVRSYALPIRMQISPEPFLNDWVAQTDSMSVRTFVLQNVAGNRSKYIRSIDLFQERNEFSIARDILPQKDSIYNFAFIPIAFRPSSRVGKNYGLSAMLRVIVSDGGNLDTLMQQITAQARSQENGNVRFQAGIRPSRDSVVSGDTLSLEIYLAQADKAALFRSTSKTMRAVVAVRADNLTLQGEWYDNKWQAIELTEPNAFPWRLFQVTGEERYGGAWGGNSDVLMKLRVKAMIGEFDQTSLRILDFQWLPADVFTTIVHLPPSQSSLTIRTCTAGGKRLFTTAKATTVSQIFPNPTNAQSEFSTTLSSAQTLEVALYNAQGNLVRRIAAGRYEEGTHSFSVETQSLAAGVYFVRVVSEEGVWQKSFSVVH